MDAQIRITGGDEIDELVSLWEWLQSEDELRGDVSSGVGAIGETDLGSALELLTVVLGSGSAGMALARSLVTWLQTRRSDVNVTVSSCDRTIVVEATNLKEALPALQEILRISDGS